MALEFYSKVFVDRTFKVVQSKDHYPNGLISEEWKYLIAMYQTLERFDIPMKSMRLAYEVTNQNEEGNPTEIKILSVDMPGYVDK
jgi:hypothetical protein